MAIAAVLERLDVLNVVGRVALADESLVDADSWQTAGFLDPLEARDLRASFDLVQGSYPDDIQCPADDRKAHLCSIKGSDAIILLGNVTISGTSAVAPIQVVYETGIEPREGWAALHRLGYEALLERVPGGWKLTELVLRLS